MSKKGLFKPFSASILFVFVILLDQFIKYKIRQEGGFYICNSGISFGLEINETFFWLSLAFFIIIFFYIHHFYNKEVFSKLSLLSLSLIGAGAFSNIIDRLIFGCVLDYIIIHPIFPVFNISDISIFLGSCSLLFSLYSKKPTPYCE